MKLSLKRRRSIFRKTAVVFVIVALVPITIFGLRSYSLFGNDLQQLVNAGKISSQRRDDLLHQTEVQSLIDAGYGLAVALVLGYFFAASVVGPIRTLQEGARRIGEGDLDFRVETDSEDELGELAATINNMANLLQARAVEVNKRNRDLQVLYEIAHAMSEARDPNQLLDKALDKALVINGSVMGCVLLMGKGGKLEPVICRVSNGGDSDGVFEHAAGMAMTSGETVVLDYSQEGDKSFDSVVCVPLKFEDSLRGALCLTITRHEFSPEKFELLSAIGSEVAVAIENARLFKQMETTNRELAEATAEIASLFSEAESHKSFGTRYQNQNLVKCWEVKRCQSRECPAYGSTNLRCWQIAGTHCDCEEHGLFAQKLGRCEKCAVFMRACPDKITLMGETFNNMMAMLEQRVKEQEELQRRLFSSSKLAAVGELAAGVAHEINNPLTGILGSAMLLKSIDPANEELQKRLSVIESETMRARDIVRGLLDFARQGNHMKTAPTSIRQLIENTLFLVRHQTDLSRIQVRTHFAAGIPELAVDANKLKQVFLNIIHNAVQSMSANGELDITAIVSTMRGGGKTVEIRFKDTGCGMDDAAMARIFDPFYTTKRVGEGTGLGLSVSHRFVSEHGGEIRVESEPGAGSTFIVVLPVNSCALTERHVA